MERTRPWWVGIGLLLSTPAAGFELWGTGPLGSATVQMSADTELRYHRAGLPEPGRRVDGPFQLFPGMPTHDYFEQVGRLNLQVTDDDLSIGLQVDQVSLFSNQYVLDGETLHSVPLYDDTVVSPWNDGMFLVEKMFVKKRWETLELTFGDAYASFGRGMALNMVKNTDIDVDTSIRGAKGIFRVDNTDITLISGLTNQQQVSQDFPNAAIHENTAHMVSGGRVEWFGPLTLGAHAVAYKFARAADPNHGSAVARYGEDLDLGVVGASVEASGLLGLDVYIEGDVYDYQAPEMAAGRDRLLGYATYASVAAYPGQAVILLEAKKTKDTERMTTFSTLEGWEPANVPTLEYERVITEDGAAAVNSNDIAGARIRVDYVVIPGMLTPYLATAFLVDKDTEGLHFNDSPETIVHPVGGVEWQDTGRVVQLNAGYRVDQRQLESEGSDRMMHLDGTFHFPLFGDESLEIDLDAKRFAWGNNEQQQADFTEMSNAVVWHHGEKWIFVAYQDWSNNPLIRSTGNLGFVDEDLYGALEVHYSPSSSTTMKAFYGAYKAGIRCSGGQCKSLPGFNGTRVSWNGVF